MIKDFEKPIPFRTLEEKKSLFSYYYDKIFRKEKHSAIPTKDTSNDSHKDNEEHNQLNEENK